MGKIILDKTEGANVLLVGDLDLQETAETIDIVRRVKELELRFKRWVFLSDAQHDRLLAGITNAYNEVMAGELGIPVHQIIGKHHGMSFDHFKRGMISYTAGEMSGKEIVKVGFSDGKGYIPAYRTSPLIHFHGGILNMMKGCRCFLYSLPKAAVSYEPVQSCQSELYSRLEGILQKPEVLPYNHID